MSRKEIYGACPRDCPDGCSWIVTVENGKAVKLRGNPDQPFTRGTLCAKTNSYLEYSALPDRLLYPMRRKGRKGEGDFERISWKEALDEIARRLQTVIQEYGAEAIWPFAGSGSVGWIQGLSGSGKRLFNKLGASEHLPTICSVSGHEGLKYTCGFSTSLDQEDFIHSKLILLWGSNPLVSNVHFWPIVRKAQKNGAKVVVIDPIRTKTAQKVDMHIALKPGTDGALTLGIIHQIIQMQIENVSYLEQMTLGWSEFKQFVNQDMSVEQAANICGIKTGDIIELGRLIADNNPMAVRLSMGMQRHAGGGQAARVISCLPAVTGDYQRLGGGLSYSSGPTYVLNKDALWGNQLKSTETRKLAMTRLGQGLLELNNPPVKALFLWAANPVVSNPDQNHIRRGLSREDLFTVVIDNFQSDTADYADILLPGAMQTEQIDLNDSYSHMYLNYNHAAVQPPGECLAHTEIFRRLAKAMGLKDPELFASDDELVEAALDSDHTALDGITLEKLKEAGWMRLNYPRPFQPFLKSFPTSSGKFEFLSERAETEGYGRLPHYVPPAEASANKPGSFALVSPANAFLINSTYAHSPLHQKAGKATLLIHPSDAREQNLNSGDMVEIGNARGSFNALLQISDTVQRGVLFTHKGLWAKFNRGSTVNATTAECDSDMGQGAVYHDNRVWLKVL